MTDSRGATSRRRLMDDPHFHSAGFVGLAVLILGGIVVLQSSEVLDWPKLAYLGVAIFVVALTFVRTALSRDSLAFKSMRELWIASAILIVVVAVSLGVAIANGTGLAAWTRDAASYGLFALVPVMAFGAHRDAPRGGLLALAVLVGAVVTFSFALTWLDRRSILDDPFERLVLPSGAFASTFFVILSAYSFRAPRLRLLWAACAGLALGAFLVVGSRSRLPFVVVPVLLGVLSGRGIRANIPSWVVQYAVTVAVVLIVPLAQAVGPRESGSDGEAPTDVLGRRVDSIDDLVTNPAGDPSMQERVAQTVAAWEVFAEQPIFGAGPGLAISWTNYSGETEKSFALDTPVIFLAKFGLIGLAAAAVWIVTFARFTRDMLRRIRGSPEWLVLVGEVAVLLYAALFSPPMQDKGMPFALMLVLAMVLRRAYVLAPGPVRA
jgi:hypothetical protein